MPCMHCLHGGWADSEGHSHSFTEFREKHFQQAADHSIDKAAYLKQGPPSVHLLCLETQAAFFAPAKDWLQLKSPNLKYHFRPDIPSYTSS